MKVYLAMAGYDCEGSQVMGIFMGKDLAQKFIDEGVKHKRNYPSLHNYDDLDCFLEDHIAHYDSTPNGFCGGADEYRIDEYEVNQ